MPLVNLVDDTLEPVCVFGTEVQSGSSKQSLGFSWLAFKWSSAASDSFTENQKIECTIKLTKDDPNQETLNCDGKSNNYTFKHSLHICEHFKQE